MLADRMSIIVIKDKKILLVSDDSDIYWTPGGKQEPGETHLEAIDRELDEELKVKSTSARLYISYEAMHQARQEMQKVYCYLTTISGDITPSSEITKYGWFSKDDMPKLMVSIKNNLIPRLVEDKLL